MRSIAIPLPCGLQLFLCQALCEALLHQVCHAHNQNCSSKSFVPFGHICRASCLCWEWPLVLFTHFAVDLWLLSLLPALLLRWLLTWSLPRTCMSCTRKSLQTSSSWAGELGWGWNISVVDRQRLLPANQLSYFLFWRQGIECVLSQGARNSVCFAGTSDPVRPGILTLSCSF